jgi:hypothetical protein
MSLAVPNFSISGVKRPFRVKNFISSGEFSQIGAVSGINYYGTKSSFNILGFQATNNSFGQQANFNDFGIGGLLNVFSLRTTESYFGYTGLQNFFGDSSAINQFGCFSTSGAFGFKTDFSSYGDSGKVNTYGFKSKTGFYGFNNEYSSFGESGRECFFGHHSETGSYSQSGKLNTFGNFSLYNEFGCTNGAVNTVNFFGEEANNTYGSGTLSGNFKITKDLIVENKIYRSNKPVWSLFRTGNVAGATDGLTFTHVPFTGSTSGFNSSGFTQNNGSGYWVSPYKGFFNIIGNCIVAGASTNSIVYHSILINGVETSVSNASRSDIARVVSSRICLLNSGDVVDMRLGPQSYANGGQDFTLQIFLIEPL